MEATELQSRSTFLIDSNVFITLEQVVGDSEPFDLAARLMRLVHDHGHRLAVHERTRDDLLRDRNEARREAHLLALRKYLVLADVPLSSRVQAAFRSDRANDEVDAAIASALDAPAAHFLVTEDADLRRRLAFACPDLADRVLSIAEAVELLDAFHPQPGEPPPLIERVSCYQLLLSDPIFDSIRADYPDFDIWFEGCQREGRSAFVVRGANRQIAALCVFKDEDDDEYGQPRRRIKLCTLKVADEHRGQRLGELLVKAALDEALSRRRSGLGLSVFEKHTGLILMLRDLGFQDTDAQTPLGERVLFRSLVAPPSALTSLDAFEVNRRYGPRVMRLDAPIHIVPIRPHWEELLFPEGRVQEVLFSDSPPCGNGLRKAYLSHAKGRSLGRGDILLFYRSDDLRAVRFVAVTEDVMLSSDPSAIVAHVGTRTVYTAEEIVQMTENNTKEVLVIRMRQARKLEPNWTRRQLIESSVMRDSPQSIQAVRDQGAEWVRQQLSE